MVIDITGEVSRHVVCEVTGGRAAIVESATEEPLATVVLDSDTFIVTATFLCGTVPVRRSRPGPAESNG